MEPRTTFYGVRLKHPAYMGDLTEHLAMNGYTFDTNGDDIIFVYDEEIDYVETILDDWEIKYEVI